MRRHELLVIDRFEDDMAVIEYGQRTFNLPVPSCPGPLKRVM